ncbi:hypothetical protein AHiyo4_24490 [Arthrobacter sp. Hiyo4]|nr:hypothetical protein AHiyo4_24490 [Arthrobacter sp. Hiyo4]
MVDAGVRILGGIAVSGAKTVGSMSFASVSERFPFVLALPRSQRNPCWSGVCTNSTVRRSSGAPG